MTDFMMSPVKCHFCNFQMNVKPFTLPCECTIYSHPECYSSYLFRSETCDICNEADHEVLRIEIPHESDNESDSDIYPKKKEQTRYVCLPRGIILMVVAAGLWIYKCFT